MLYSRVTRFPFGEYNSSDQCILINAKWMIRVKELLSKRIHSCLIYEMWKIRKKTYRSIRNWDWSKEEKKLLHPNGFSNRLKYFNHTDLANGTNMFLLWNLFFKMRKQMLTHRRQCVRMETFSNWRKTQKHSEQWKAQWNFKNSCFWFILFI